MLVVAQRNEKAFTQALNMPTRIADSKLLHNSPIYIGLLTLRLAIVI